MECTSGKRQPKDKENLLINQGISKVVWWLAVEVNTEEGNKCNPSGLEKWIKFHIPTNDIDVNRLAKAECLPKNLMI